MSRILLLLLLGVFSCNSETNTPLDLQGHRGARGLMPENSIPGFILAAEMGVTTLELDLAVTKDDELIVSHEPYFSSAFCSDTTGARIPKDSIINVYTLAYDQVRQFDCGSWGNERFPEQRKLKTTKPSLSEVIDTVEAYLKIANQTIRYNIELKTSKETDDIFHPTPSKFSELVYELLSRKNILDRVTIQSFDFRTLTYFHSNFPDIELALLIENKLAWDVNLDSLGFTPEIYSCHYELLSRKRISEMQTTGMKVIPWTVNEASDMQKLIGWGVDGIITDYPDRALEVIKK